MNQGEIELKLTWYVVIAMMCLNVSVVIMGAWGLTPIAMTAFNSTKFEEGMNATEIVRSWDWAEKDFYDVGAGLGFLWNMNLPLIESAFGFFQSINTPPQILFPLKALWRFTMACFVISLLSGRDFMP